MANKLIKRRYNNLLTVRNNYFAVGGSTGNDDPYHLRGRYSTPGIVDGMGGVQNPSQDYQTPQVPQNGNNKGPGLLGSLGAALKGGLQSGALSGAATAVGGMVGSAIGGGMSSGVGDVIGGLGNIASAIPGPWGAIAGAGLKVVGGLTNRMFGSKLNEENIAAVEGTANRLNNFQSDASDFDTLSQNWANADAGATFSDSYIGKDGWFSDKAKNKAAALREQIELGNAWVQNSLNNNAENISNAQMQNLLANYAAFGGNLMTHGADFDTGLVLVGNGGTHEENPNEGVPMGVDSEGIPNLVEEGEVIFNDYVFSKRLKVPKALRRKYKLRGAKPLTFADAALQMSKESEERPNDPISQAGLIDSMTKLMSAQEQIREREGERQFARGGHLFDDGGWSQTLNYNNLTPGLTFGQKGFNPYNQNGEINWDIMYGAESPFMKRRNYVINNWDSDTVRGWLPKYVQSVNAYNKGRKGFTPLTVEGLTKDIFSKGTADGHWGGMHAGIDLAGNPEPIAPREKGKRMYLTNRRDASGTPLEDLLIPDYDPATGTYKYVRTGNSSEGNTDYTDLFYEERPAESPKEKAPDLSGEDNGEYPDYDNALRYMPIVGAAIGLGTSLFTKPDDSDASAVLAASSGKGAYRPVSYKPIGNYLTYRPFDRDYYINKMNAEAGASRRALLNTSGGNRATAMAGILGADNNYLNQLGALARQAEEYNLAQRQKVEEFNRATNIQNSQGFLQADMANQEALAKARDFTLRGVMAAADLRSKARLAREQAISANLSNIFNSLGDIGKEKVDRKWRTWASKHGVYAPVQEEAYGGRIKRRKRGLTF